MICRRVGLLNRFNNLVFLALHTVPGVRGFARLPSGATYALHVLLAAEHMRVVLLEGARPHDAVERTGRLIAVASAELGIADRKLPPRVHPQTG